MQIQYLGFRQNSNGRDYTYRVLKTPTEARQFTFTISNQSFLERRVPYQDAPDVCYRRLQEVLETETEEQPAPRHMRLTNQELDEYRERHRPARKRSW